MHVKVFNTGKMEIPGVINEEILTMVKQNILSLIQSHVDLPLEFIETTEENNILINSNFNCGFFLNRDVLHATLRSSKYGIETAYDPCSYPGVKCKFYYNNRLALDDPMQNGQILSDDRGMKMSEIGDNKTYTEVSFMIFRTGSCLIVGNCSEPVLQVVYRFIRNILREEYSSIYVPTSDQPIKIKKPKIRKRTVEFTVPSNLGGAV
jgi:TATA-box binding protein (TBP) (component of TFIID and TFIIIB)